MPTPLKTTQTAACSPDLSAETAVLIDVTFPATELCVRGAVGASMDRLSAFQIAPDFQFTVEIVLAELLNNIVEHGYPCPADPADGDIQLKISIIENRIEISTRDQGVQMPGLRVPHPPEPDLEVDRENLPEGQFGWFMIRELCNDLEYRRVGSENQFTLNILQ